MMRSVVLYGALAEEFGPTFKFDIATPIEAVRALECAFPGRFMKHIHTGRYRVTAGKELDNGHFLGERELAMCCPHDVHICPVIEGAGGNSGPFEIVLGVALIALAVWTGGTAIAAGATFAQAVGGSTVIGLSVGSVGAIGIALTFSGLSAVLTKMATQKAGLGASFLYSGPQNVQTQGGAIPAVYGEYQVGSVVVSADVTITDGAAQSSQSSWTGGTQTFTNGSTIMTASILNDIYQLVFNREADTGGTAFWANGTNDIDYVLNNLQISAEYINDHGNETIHTYVDSYLARM